ncbi:Tn3 family transposase [Streptomyces sp. PSRA5]
MTSRPGSAGRSWRAPARLAVCAGRAVRPGRRQASRQIVTDTASYSDIVFGLLTLAGFTYAPQLADLPEQKMWRIDRTADHGAFQDAARGRDDLARMLGRYSFQLPELPGGLRPLPDSDADGDR